MPMIHVELMAGRTEDQLKNMVVAITDAMVGTTGATRESIQVVIEEVEPTRWAAAGRLAADAQ
jgi:4-oxalocrotonate tautomerase